ncbi:MAG: hypothetical protein HYW47_01330 [Deltaproteobacteria bacterium]|nr:hypothetical protein [Deltaproteobacteria bacterium]
MKFKLFFIMFFFSLILRAQPEGSISKIQDNFEPNDTIEQSKPITFETPHIFSLKEQTDQDWFSFVIPALGSDLWGRHLPGQAPAGIQDQPKSYTTFNIGGFSNTSRYFSVEVFDQNKKPIPIFEKKQNLPFTLLLESGKYYLKVTHAIGQLYTQKLTHLFLSVTPNIDSLEPNDKKEEARPAKFNQYQSLHLFHAGDLDYFHFEIPEQGYFRVFVDKKYALQTRYEIISQKTNLSSLHTAEGNSRDLKSEATFKNVPISGYEWIRIEPGKYFIKFYRSEDGYRLWYRKYPFYLKFLPEIDSGVPHTDKQSARVLQLGKVGFFYIPIMSDQNYFKVEIPEEGRYFLMVRPGYKENGVFETEICPENESNMEDKCEQFQNFDRYKNFKKGVYYINIYRKYRYTSFIDQKFELLLVKGDGGKSPLDFYIIDLEGGNATEALKKVTEAAGGHYVQAKSEREIKQALQAAAKQKGRSFLWLMIVAAILIACGLGGFYLYKKRNPL